MDICSTEALMEVYKVVSNVCLNTYVNFRIRVRIFFKTLSRNLSCVHIIGRKVNFTWNTPNRHVVFIIYVIVLLFINIFIKATWYLITQWVISFFQRTWRSNWNKPRIQNCLLWNFLHLRFSVSCFLNGLQVFNFFHYPVLWCFRP